MGFQDMRPVVHQAASRKGGSVRKKKGLATLSPERRKEIASQGGKASRANRSKTGIEQKEADRSQEGQRLADALGDIDGI